MRYENIDTLQFIDSDNNLYIIKDKRIIPKYTIVTKYKKKENELADVIACKKEIYGEDSEMLAYRIYEANIIEIVENKFNFEKLKLVDIPTMED